MARSRRRRGRSRGEPSPVLITALAVLAAGLIAVLIFWYLDAIGHRPDNDEINCPRKGSATQTLVLVDTSDSIAEVTRHEIAQRLHDVGNTIPVGGRLTIRMLRPNTTQTEQIFDLCNPGDGSNLNDWTGNPKRARDKWEKGFEGPLNEALERATGDNTSDTSPIMAAIQNYAVDRLVSQVGQATPTTLLVVSDMLENTPDFSMYKSGADIAAFSASAAASRYFTNLGGASVEIWLILRLNPPADGNALVSFWSQWVSRANGAMARIQKLQGVSDG